MPERRGIPPPEAEASVTKKRYDEYSTPVDVIEDEAYRKRLEHLRAVSIRVNKMLQQKLEKADLPYYSWNKSSASSKPKSIEYPKILRLAILLRPEFFRSSEKKTRETRYSGRDEQFTLFLHIRNDNSIQLVRLKFDFTHSAYGIYFAHSVAPDLSSPGSEDERGLLEGYIQKEDIEGLTDYIIEKLSPPIDGEATNFAQHSTEIFKRAYGIASLEEASRYFATHEVVLYQPKEWLRNLGKVVIMSVLEKTLLEQVEAGKKTEEIKEVLRDEAEKLLDVGVANYHNPGKLASFIPNADAYISQTIRQLMRAYKSRILGWKK